MRNDPSAVTRSAGGERLTAAELAAWRGMLRVQGRVLRRVDAAVVAEHGLTLAEYEILLRLSEQPGGRLRMALLADAIIRPRSTLTRVVGALEARGLVRRADAPDDGRGTTAVLTAAGRRRFRSAQQTNLRAVRAAFLDHLDDGQLRCLASAWEAIDPAALAPAPDER